MKRFIIKTYRILFNLIGIRPVAFIIALAYISFLNIITLYGCCILLEDLIPTSAALRFFSFPYVVVTAIVVLAVNLITTPPYYTIPVSQIKRENYSMVVIYTIISAVLFVYTLYCQVPDA
jgi:hypothetical protein